MLSARLAARVLIAGVIVLSSAAVAGAQSGASDIVLLDFWSESCGPCRSMEGTIAQLTQAGYPIRKININQGRDLAHQFQVTVIPAFVLVRNGQEIGRLEGVQSIGDLQGLFAKARAASIPATSSTTTRQPPGATAGTGAAAGTSASAANWTTAAGSASAAAAPAAASASVSTVTGAFVPAGRRPGSTGVATSSSHLPGSPAASSASSAGKCLAATVRLTVEDATGLSCGTGTLIDSRNGEALILTCGHIFRDSKGKGKITVDVFGPNPQTKLVGQVVGYDLKRDVGLVSIRPHGTVATTPVAPVGHVVRVGDRVISVGCDGGADPTVRESRVTAVNRFLGPPNVEVSGQPTQGRSGGGLFSADGYVIGVCNAADPAENEGMFAASATIQGQLDQAGLTALYRRANEPAIASVASALSAGSGATSRAASGDASGGVPSMAAQMPPSPLTALASRGAAAVASGMASGAVRSAMNSLANVTAGGGGELQNLSPQERATLGALAQKSQNAEVICIMRPLNDPQAKSEIIILDRASPAFLRQLSSEQTTQAARHLTSLEIARYAGPGAPAGATSTPSGAMPQTGLPRTPAAASPSAPGSSPTARTWQPSWR